MIFISWLFEHRIRSGSERHGNPNALVPSGFGAFFGAMHRRDFTVIFTVYQ
jgi:hypothetical protein